MIRRFTIFLFILWHFTTSMMAQSTSNKGTEFWVGYMGHIDGTSSNMSLYITSDVNTSGKVQIPGKSWSTNYTVTANSITVVTIPQSLAYMGCTECTLSQGIRVTAYQPVVVYAHIYSNSRSDATLVLPAETMGRDYYTMSYNQSATGSSRQSEFMIVAVEDSTYIDITPKVSLLSGKAAGSTYQILLKYGEVYQAQANTDITGTKITSNVSKNKTCKKIAVYSGSSWTALGCGSASSGDNLFQQMYPVSAWGKEFATAPWKTRKGGDIYRVLASQNSTKIIVNGWNTQTINAGTWYEWMTDSACHIIADKPIICAQYQRTQNCDNVTGDPSMVILNPVEQQLNDITLYSSPYQNITGHYINVVMETDDTASFRLDGNPVSWTKINSNTNYAYTQATVSSGNHRLKADSGFNAIAYGFGNVESYGYSAGANIKNLNQFISLGAGTKTCIGKPTQFEGYAVYTPLSWKWYFGDGKTDTVQNPAHTYSDTGTYTASLVTIKSNGNDCESQDSTIYTVKIYSNPTAGLYTSNECGNDSVQFYDSSFVTGSSIVAWNWTFGNGKTSTEKNPKMKYSTAGTYYVTLKATAQTGCDHTVGKNITINPAPVPAFRVTSAVCPEDTVIIYDSTTLAGSFSTSPACYKTVVNWGDGSAQDTFTGYIGNAYLKHKYTSGVGTYTIKMTGINCQTGCKDSVSKSVTLYPPATPKLSFNNACQKDSVSFFDSSSISSGSISLYSIDFGDGNTKSYTPSTLPKPFKKLYSTPGTYTITYTVTNAAGCAKSIQYSITIYPKPVTAFTVANVCQGQSATFYENGYISTGSITSKKIDFGDGDDSIFNSSSISHKYNAPGIYNVKVYLYSDKGCVDSGSLSITIYPLPQPSFTFSNGCAEDANITFTDNSTITSGNSISTRFWNFGDGGTLTTTSTSVNYIYKNPGTYTITLFLTSNRGCVDSLKKNITIFEKPKAGFIANSPCIYTPVSFTDTSVISTSTITQWQVQLGDGNTKSYTSLSGGGWTHQYTTAGTYQVRLIITTSQGCKDTAYQTVVVKPQANPGFKASSSCLDDSIVFIDTTSSQTISSRYWNMGDGKTYTQDSIIKHKYTSSGNKTITLIVTGTNGCADTIIRTITIYPKPTASFNASAGCTANPVSFTHASTISSGSISKYIWNFGDSSSQTQTSPSALTHKYAQGGYKTVVLIVESNQGCRDTMTKIIYVIPMPDADFTIPNVCFKDSVTFYDLTTLDSGTLTHWYFNFGDGTSVTYNTPGPFKHKYDTVGNYQITMIVSNSWGCPDTVSRTFTVNSSPIAKIAYDPPCINNPVQFYDSSTIAFGNVYQWRWDFGDGITDTIAHPTHQYADTGVYTVRLRVASGQQCIDSTSTNIRVRPNPISNFTVSSVCADDSATFNFTGTLSHGKINQIYWDFGDGADTLLPGTQSQIKHKYASGGTYLTKGVAISEYGCPDTAQKSLQIKYKPFARFNVDDVCQYQSIQAFDSSTVTLDSIAQWRWEYGDGYSTTYTKFRSAVSHQYGAPGKYGITLYVTSYQGCKDTLTDTVTIHPAPNAMIGASHSAVCEVGHAITFSDNTVIASGTWTRRWDFGDGQSDTSKNPVHTYAQWGTYPVRLITTSNYGCVDTAWTLIKVYETPEARIELPNKIQCFAGHQFNPTDSSRMDSGSWTRVWNWGDGSTDTSAQPLKTYINPGTYTLRLVVTGIQGCRDTTYDTIQVNPSPKAGFTVNQSTQCEKNHQFEALDTSKLEWGTYQRLWDWGDGFQDTAAKSFHTFAQPGSYPITLYLLTDKGCIDSNSKQLQVNPTPKVRIYMPVNQQCLTGNTFYLADSSTLLSGTYTRHWDFGDGSTSTLANPTKTYINSGTYTIRLALVSNLACRDTAWDSVIVHPMTNIGFSIHDQQPCFPDQPIIVSDTSSISRGTYSRLWYWGDGAVDTSIQANHRYSTPGTYTISLITQTDQGCADTLKKDVTIRPEPQAGITLNVKRTCFFNHEIQYQDVTSIYSGSWTRTWDFGDGQTDTSNAGTHVYTQPGTYIIRLSILADAGCRDTIQDTVIIDPMPKAGFTVNDHCLGDTTWISDTSSLAWGTLVNMRLETGDGKVYDPWIPGGQAFPHLYQNPGTYTIRLLVNSDQGCRDTFVSSVDVYPKPSPKIKGIVSCETDSISFYDSSTILLGNISRWDWDFGDGATESYTAFRPIVKHKYQQGGRYAVKVKEYSGLGCVDSITLIQNVYYQPEMAFSAPEHCINDSGILFDQSNVVGSYIVNRYWEFGDGQSLSTSLSYVRHQYPAPGTYQVTLVSTSAEGCADTLIQSVVVHPLPSPSIQSVQVCQFEEVLIPENSTIQFDSIVKQEWDFGDGLTEVHFPPFGPVYHVYSMHGQFDVKLKLYSSFGCEKDTQVTATVYPRPEIRLYARNVCEGDTVYITDSSRIANGSIVQWDWDLGDGTLRTDNTQPPRFAHYYNTPGDYTITVYTTSDQGCRDTLKASIVVHPLPDVRFSRSPNDGCAPLTVSFFDSSSQVRDTMVAWIWEFGDGLGSVLQNPVHTYDIDRLYQPRLTVISNAGCKTTWEDTLPIYVMSKPKTDFSFVTDPVSNLYPDVRFQDHSLHANRWYWNFGDGRESYKQFPVHTYEDTGWYQVSLITWNALGCTDTLNKKLLVYPEVRIWLPNAFSPNDDDVNDTWGPEGFTDGMRNYNLTIWNRWGQIVFETNNPKEHWNGKMKNKGPEGTNDVYVYRMEWIDYFYKKHFRHGDIQLMR